MFSKILLFNYKNIIKNLNNFKMKFFLNKHINYICTKLCYLFLQLCLTVKNAIIFK